MYASVNVGWCDIVSMQFTMREFGKRAAGLCLSRRTLFLRLKSSDEVGRLRLAKNFGFSLSVEIYSTMPSTKTTRVLRHGNGVRIVNWLAKSRRHACSACLGWAVTNPIFDSCALKEKELISRLSSPEKFLHFPLMKIDSPELNTKLACFLTQESFLLGRS